MARLATRRALWLLAGATLVFGLAALPALGTMSDHGTAVIAFEVARTSARAADIVSRWGAEGRSAAPRVALWLDYPFLISYGLLLAGSCWAVSRLHRARPTAGRGPGQCTRVGRPGRGGL